MAARIIALPIAPAPRMSMGAAGNTAGLWAKVAAMLDARRSRQALAEMDAHHLADIGLSRGDAVIEAGRSFWDLAPRRR